MDNKFLLFDNFEGKKKKSKQVGRVASDSFGMGHELNGARAVWGVFFFMILFVFFLYIFFWTNKK